jgi:hypothetical protein
MVNYTTPRSPRNVTKIAALGVAAVALFAGGIAVDRFVFTNTDSPSTAVASSIPDEACARGDDALAASAAGQLAELVPVRVKGEQAAQETARKLGAAPEVAEKFGAWAAQEPATYRHAIFGASAVKITKREGDRATVSVDGFWLRSPEAANAGGEFMNALWSYTVVWSEGRWVPAAAPEATTLPGSTTNRALAFIRSQDGYSGVPYVRC